MRFNSTRRMVNYFVQDQPNQVGYSYDTLTNVTASINGEGSFGSDIQPADFSAGVPEQNLTFRVSNAGWRAMRDERWTDKA